MAQEDVTLAEKCENLMLVVVESRKRFGKMWQEYNNKSALVQEKMLIMQLKMLANYNRNANRNLPVDSEDSDCDTDIIKKKIFERQKGIEGLQKKIKDTHLIVTQMKSDKVNKMLHLPLPTEDQRAPPTQ